MKKVQFVGLQSELDMEIGDVIFAVDFDADFDGYLIEKVGEDEYTLVPAYENGDGYTVFNPDGEFHAFEDEPKVKAKFNEEILAEILTYDFDGFDGEEEVKLTPENLISFVSAYEIWEDESHELHKYLTKVDLDVEQPNFAIGQEVKIKDEFVENYEDLKGMNLFIEGYYKSSQEFNLYDEAMEGMPLYVMIDEDGNDIPYALYEYELESAE